MNKKITVQNGNRVRYCVLSDKEPFDKQLNEWYFGSNRSGGMGVGVYSETIEIMDVYHQEPLAVFKILSIEDTEEDVLLAWMNDKTGKTGWAD